MSDNLFLLFDGLGERREGGGGRRSLQVERTKCQSGDSLGYNLNYFLDKAFLSFFCHILFVCFAF